MVRLLTLFIVLLGCAKTAITSEILSDVCLGMSLGEIETQLGRAGQRTNDTNETEDAVTYEWHNADGSYLWILFVADEATGMGHIGLQSSDELAAVAEPTVSTEPASDSGNCPFR